MSNPPHNMPTPESGRGSDPAPSNGENENLLGPSAKDAIGIVPAKTGKNQTSLPKVRFLLRLRE